MQSTATGTATGQLAAPQTRQAFLLRIVVAVATVLMLLAVLVRVLIGEPLRRSTENALNAALQGYSVTLPRLAFHPLGFSLTLYDLTVAQTAHPDPPVAHFPRLHASVHWRALLRARLVSDFVFEQPKVRIDRQQAQHEAADKVALSDKGWQQALEAIYPFKINRFEVRNGDVTYVDDDPQRPLHLRHLNLLAENIRNIRSRDHVYPSDIHLDGVIFDTGSIRVDGHANLLAEPHAAVDADLDLEHVDVSHLQPVTARYNVWISEGILSATGHTEYAPQTKNFHLKQLVLRGAKVDYVHSAETAVAEAEHAATVKRAAKEVAQTSSANVWVDEVRVEDSIIGFKDDSSEPPYRLFLAKSNLILKNLSNQQDKRPATVALTGRFMGTGNSSIRARLQSLHNNPDVDVAVEIDETRLPSMNGLLRSFGGFDVVGGRFSFYSELSVKDGNISGYLKPAFENMKVYDRRQDAEKPFLRQVYEALVGAIQTTLQNGEGTVGTRVDISGRVSDPQTSTWQVVVGLIENAFFKALKPGLEPDSNKEK